MNSNKRDALREILKLGFTDQPGKDFTWVVMRELTEASEDVAFAKDKVRSLIVRSGPDEVPTDFAHKVMREVKRHANGAGTTEVKPVITSKGWIGMATSVLLLVIISSFGDQDTQTVSDITRPFLVGINKFFSNVDYFSSMYFIVPCSLCVLLAIDYGCRNLFHRALKK